MLRFRRCGAALALVALLGSAVPAAADENAEARAFFEEGNRYLGRALRARGARRERLLNEAFGQYVESLRIVRSRNTVFNAAHTLQELGRHDEAFAYYREYLGMPGLTDEERAEANRRLDGLREHVAVVAIRSTPPGAEVRIGRRDLAPRGTTPLEVALPPGQHRVFLRREGFEPTRLTATATQGERVTLEETLTPEPVPVVVQAPPGGRLTINGEPVEPGQRVEVIPGRHTIRYEPAVERVIEIEPGSGPRVIELDVPDPPRGRGMLAIGSDVAMTVRVDGAVVGEGTEVEARLPAGRHTLEVEAPGHAPARSQITVQPGERVTVQAELARSVEDESRFGAAPIYAWVATGLVGTTALVLGGRALLTNADYEDACPSSGDAAQCEADLAAVEDANLLADVLFVGTAAVGIGALVLTLLNEPVEQPPSALRIGEIRLDGGLGPDGALVRASLPWGAP